MASSEDSRSVAEPLSKNPISLKLMTNPSRCSLSTTTCARISGESAFSISAWIPSISPDATALDITPWPRLDDAAQIIRTHHIFNHLRILKGHGFGGRERHLRVGSFENSHLLEGHLDCQRKFADFALIHLRRGIEHYEEREKQGDEVRVGYQPALVIGMLFMTFLAAHAVFSRLGSAAGGAASLLAGFALRFASAKKPSNLVSIMRGFMPSRMEITPSSIISRTICS